MKKKYQQELNKVKRELKKRLKKNFIEMRIFGSRLKGDYSFFSDIDILVLVKKRNIKTEKIIFDLLTKFSLKFDIPIDITIYSFDEWQKEVSLKTPFSQSIIKESLII